MGGGTSGVGGERLPDVSHEQGDREVGAFGHEFTVHGLPSHDDTRGHDDDQSVDVESEDLHCMPR